MNFIGIDNGNTGGIACIDEMNRIIQYKIIPTQKIDEHKVINLMSLRAWLRDMEPISFICLERGAKNPLFGCKGNFTNGVCFGMVKGMLDLMPEYRHKVVTPKEWQDELLIDKKKSKKDKPSIAWCNKFHPAHSIKNHNITDAICLAHYAKHLYCIGS